MEQQKKQNIRLNIIILLVGLFVALVVVNVIFLLLFRSELKTIRLLRKEQDQVEQDKRIMEASSDILQQYSKEIKEISNVFPNEENISLFIQTLESSIRQIADEYTFKFSSLTPIAEGDKLFLLLSITMKTDLPKFSLFLSSLETMPYMTHVTAISARTPSGFMGKGEVSLGLKVYVQNPFTTK